MCSHAGDPLPEIEEIVRDTIESGLITTITVEDFDQAMSVLSGADKEDYLQELWDRV